MPWGLWASPRQATWCERPYGWSTHRGGCRHQRGHEGTCAPGRYRR